MTKGKGKSKRLIKDLEIIIDLDYILPHSGIKETENGYLVPNGSDMIKYTRREIEELLLKLKQNER